MGGLDLENSENVHGGIVTVASHARNRVRAFHIRFMKPDQQIACCQKATLYRYGCMIRSSMCKAISLSTQFKSLNGMDLTRHFATNLLNGPVEYLLHLHNRVFSSTKKTT
jgi:hypothetical protein